ncbi:MarR family winged helix-turn-helix transcriptional regulator [uncultured Pseudokineococcus sp.]|uniref:MarR family winged helix-turn-helix transcriptional regulator n=1 Tax=uncultured Pseudokineococcus sp. TaxID=1642928 RepID=UPI002638140B|nr:MarR family winged helix-turn-helix transcriptional regulator [uncultured Pseudokineococcus sp.]
MITARTAADLLEEARGLHRSTRALLRRPASDRAGAAAEAVLALLAEAGEVRPGALACRVGASPSVLSRQLADLEEAGLVERRADPDDGRAHLVRTSPDGDALLAATASARAERLRGVLDAWSEHDARAALASLARLRHDLETAAGDTRSGASAAARATPDHRTPDHGTSSDEAPDHRHPPEPGRRRPAVHHPDPTTAATGHRAVRADQEVGA